MQTSMNHLEEHLSKLAISQPTSLEDPVEAIRRGKPLLPEQWGLSLREHPASPAASGGLSKCAYNSYLHSSSLHIFSRISFASTRIFFAYFLRLSIF